MFCRNCGKKICDGGKYCKYCGTPVAETVKQTTQNKRQKKIQRSMSIPSVSFELSKIFNEKKEMRIVIPVVATLLVFILAINVGGSFIEGVTAQKETNIQSDSLSNLTSAGFDTVNVYNDSSNNEETSSTTSTNIEITDEECEHCNGDGECRHCFLGDCENCFGVGTLDCLNCFGSGNCQTCGGSGEITSYTYNSEGVVTRKCSSCHGSGDCRSCDGTGNRECSYCNGSGDCSYCGGTFKCQYCGGTGKLI